MPEEKLGHIRVTGESVETAETVLGASLGETTSVINTSSLMTIAGNPAEASDLSLNNAISQRNLSQQNAVSNQQRVQSLGLSVLGKTVRKVSAPTVLEARSSMDVISGNEMAETLASLKAAIDMFNNGASPVNPDSPRRKLIKKLVELIRILELNYLYQGKGTYEDPLVMRQSQAKLYLTLDACLGFKGISAEQLDVSEDNGISIKK
ncbi:MAG: hypothetical protein JW739_06725 [Opitutales bacterium]|nr:hypothetical protein [Opitutales bacterium]